MHALQSQYTCFMVRVIKSVVDDRKAKISGMNTDLMFPAMKDLRFQ